MDDQRTDRASRVIRRLLLALGIIPLTLAGGYLTVIASLGVAMAVRNYDPKMAMFFGAATMGFICGVGSTIGIWQFTRRYKVRFTRYSVRDLLVGTTIVAIAFGLIA